MTVEALSLGSRDKYTVSRLYCATLPFTVPVPVCLCGALCHGCHVISPWIRYTFSLVRRNIRVHDEKSSSHTETQFTTVRMSIVPQ